ncbi:MAG: glutamine--fructose-6-phosphate transaminase (isomerizing) [Pseudomonadales bacterium]|nr:glutamine--fructose-6-phosphate transaminase (isomerizing) [Pseudomonadales bacterium]
MCGIVGAIADRNVTPILLEGLRRLEYRGYDSAGVAVIDYKSGSIERTRRLGKVKELDSALLENPHNGHIGIAHTRWATHGVPSESNAHPHMSGSNLAIVHNGIIENFESLREELATQGYEFQSETDTEVIVHLLHHKLKSNKNLLLAVKDTMSELDGAFALGVISKDFPDKLITSRKGSPLVIGVGIGENYIGSDQLALMPVTNRFIFLEEGDLAEITKTAITIFNEDHKVVTREITEFDTSHDQADKGEYRHYMLKEIYEQPSAVQSTLEGRIAQDHVLEDAFGPGASDLFDKVKCIQIIACGTSFHAGLTARYWFEGLAGVPCNVEVASEFRYRTHVVQPGTLFVTISQSGETADTLAALRDIKSRGYIGTLTVCNVPGSSLVRESDLALMTKAGAEIGVASTKAFTTQLVALFMLNLVIGRRFNVTKEQEARSVHALRSLPSCIESTLALDSKIEVLSERFGDKHHALFLGRGAQYPVAMEGALKLKEISYIHAEAYAAGELKHGPLALVDADMPVITVAPNNVLLEKLKSNLQEVRARGGELYIFADKQAGVSEEEGVHVLEVPHVCDDLAPIVYTIPLQLLSYHVALIKGTDVDQPRNLAKSVTVE